MLLSTVVLAYDISVSNPILDYYHDIRCMTLPSIQGTETITVEDHVVEAPIDLFDFNAKDEEDGFIPLPTTMAEYDRLYAVRQIYCNTPLRDIPIGQTLQLLHELDMYWSPLAPTLAKSVLLRAVNMNADIIDMAFEKKAPTSKQEEMDVMSAQLVLMEFNSTLLKAFIDDVLAAPPHARARLHALDLNKVSTALSDDDFLSFKPMLSFHHHTYLDETGLESFVDALCKGTCGGAINPILNVSNTWASYKPIGHRVQFLEYIQKRIVYAIRYNLYNRLATYFIEANLSPEVLAKQVNHVLRQGYDSVKIETLKVLLQVPGIDVYWEGRTQRTPLIAAIEYGWIDHAKMWVLLPTDHINAQDDDGRTALWWAARRNYADLVESILKAPNVDVNRVGGSSHWSPLLVAARYKHYEAIKVLLQHPDIEVNLRDIDRNTALVMVAGLHYDLTRLLLNFPGIDVNLENHSRQTPLMESIIFYDDATAALLLGDPRVDVNLRDRDGFTALMWAAYNNATYVAKLLLASKDINVGLRSKGYETAAQVAYKRKHMEIYKMIRKYERNLAYAKMRSLWTACFGE